MDEMTQTTNQDVTLKAKEANEMDDLTETDALPQKREQRVVWLVLGGGLLLVLLVGAAFVAGHWLAWQPPQKDVEVIQTGGEGGESMGVQTIIGGDQPIELPEERPDESPAVVGVVTRRDGNGLFVGTGLTGVGRNRPDGSIEMEHNGPEVEIVVTHDTEIYKESIETDTRQVSWEPGSLDDIAQNAVVTAWGEKRGDRVVARVLVYNPMRIELP